LPVINLYLNPRQTRGDNKDRPQIGVKVPKVAGLLNGWGVNKPRDLKIQNNIGLETYNGSTTAALSLSSVNQIRFLLGVVCINCVSSKSRRTGGKCRTNYFKNSTGVGKYPRSKYCTSLSKIYSLFRLSAYLLSSTFPFTHGIYFCFAHTNSIEFFIDFK